MKIFLDTSILFKLYHYEMGAEEIDNLFTHHKINVVFLSEITKIEFSSTVWKKVRGNEITLQEAQGIIGKFKNDFGKFTFVEMDNIVVEQAQYLIEKYGKEGLRTLDSIQLSTAVLLKNQLDLCKTADQLLSKLFISEKLPV